MRILNWLLSLIGFKKDQNNQITLHDQNGNKVSIAEKEYKNKVLLRQFKENWNNPDGLYSMILLSLRDNFYKVALKPTKRLIDIDGNKERAYTIRATVLLKNNLLNKAEGLLEKYCKKYEPTGSILTNLAKVYAEKKENKECIATLWSGLELDPNQASALDWWGTIHRENGGEDEYLKALERVAEIEGSWRAQLLLARIHIENDEIDEAFNLYEKVLNKAEDHSDVLLSISGDLGKKGLYQKLFDIISPRYDVKVHNPLVGINLIRAYLETEQCNEGIILLNQLKTLNKYNLSERLDYFYDKFNEVRYGKSS